MTRPQESAVRWSAAPTVAGDASAFEPATLNEPNFSGGSRFDSPDIPAGDLADAEARYRRALTIKRQLFGTDHRDVAVTLNNLATICRVSRRVARRRLSNCSAVRCMPSSACSSPTIRRSRSVETTTRAAGPDPRTTPPPGAGRRAGQSWIDEWSGHARSESASRAYQLPSIHPASRSPVTSRSPNLTSRLTSATAESESSHSKTTLIARSAVSTPSTPSSSRVARISARVTVNLPSSRASAADAQASTGSPAAPIRSCTTHRSTHRRA